MNKLFINFILFTLLGIPVKGLCQIIGDDVREGLKGKVAMVKSTEYSFYPEIQWSSVSMFDANGYIINVVNSDSLQLPANIWRFKYNHKKKLSRFIKIRSGKVQSTYTNIYNNKGYLVQQNLVTNDHTFFKPVKYFFKYNNQGQLLEVYSEKYGIDISPSKDVFTYDKNGLIKTRSIYNGYGYLINKIFMEYNKHRDIIKSVNYYDVMSPDKLHTNLYSYTYDKKGNWIVKRKNDGNPDKFEIIETREITYR